MFKRLFHLVILILSISFLTACGGGGGGGGGGSTPEQDSGDVDRIVIIPSEGEIEDIYTVKKTGEASIIEIPFVFKMDSETGLEVMPEVSIGSQDSDGAEVSFKKAEDLAPNEKNKLIIKWEGSGSDLDTTDEKNIRFTINYSYEGKLRSSAEYNQKVIYEGNKVNGLPTGLIELRNTMDGDTKEFDLNYELPLSSNYIKEIELIQPQKQEGVVASIIKVGDNFKLKFYLEDEYADKSNKSKSFDFHYDLKAVVKDKVDQNVLSERLYSSEIANIKLVREDVDDVEVVFVDKTIEDTITVLMGTKDIIIPYEFWYKKPGQADIAVNVSPEAISETDAGEELAISFVGNTNNLKISWDGSDINSDNLVTKVAKYRVKYTYKEHAKRTALHTQTINFVPITINSDLPKELVLSNSLEMSSKDVSLKIISPDTSKYDIFKYKNLEVVQNDNKDKIKIEYFKGNNSGEGTLRFSLADGFVVNTSETLTVTYVIKATAGEASDKNATRVIEKTVKINLKALEVDNIKITPVASDSSISMLAALNNTSAGVEYTVELNGTDVSNNLSAKGIELYSEKVNDGSDEDVNVSIDKFSNKLLLSWDGTKIDLNSPNPKVVKYRLKYKYKNATMSSGIYTVTINFTPIKISGDVAELELKNAIGKDSSALTFSIISPTEEYAPKMLTVKSVLCPSGVICDTSTPNKITFSLKDKITDANKGIFPAKYEVEAKVGNAIRTFSKDINIKLAYENVDKIEIVRTTDNTLKAVMPNKSVSAVYKFTLAGNPATVSPEAVFVDAVFVKNGLQAGSVGEENIALNFVGNNLNFTWNGSNDLLNEANEIKVKYKIKYTYGGLTNLSDTEEQTIIYQPILVKGHKAELGLNNRLRTQQLAFSISSPEGYSYNSLAVKCDAGQDLGILTCKSEGNKLTLALKEDITQVTAGDINVDYTLTAKVGDNEAKAATREIKNTVVVKLSFQDVDKIEVKMSQADLEAEGKASFTYIRPYGNINNVVIPFNVELGGSSVSDVASAGITLSANPAKVDDATLSFNNTNLEIKWADDAYDKNFKVQKTFNFKVVYSYAGVEDSTKSYLVEVVTLPIIIDEPAKEVTLKNDINERSKTIKLKVNTPADESYGNRVLSVNFLNSDNTVNAVFDGVDTITYSLKKDIKKGAVSPVLKYKVTVKVGDSVRVFDKETKVNLVLTSADEVSYSRTTVGENIYIAMPLKDGRVNFDFKVNNAYPSNIGYETVIRKAVFKGTNTEVSDLSLSYEKDVANAGKMAVKATWNGSSDKLNQNREIEVKYAIQYTYGGNTNLTEDFTNTFIYEPITLTGLVNSGTLKNTDNSKEFSTDIKITTTDSVKGVRSVAINVTNPYATLFDVKPLEGGKLVFTLKQDVTAENAKEYVVNYDVKAKIGDAERTYSNNKVSVILAFEDVDKIDVSKSAEETINVVMSENPIVPFSFKEGAIEVDITKLQLSVKVDGVKTGNLSDYSAFFKNGTKDLELVWSGSKINANVAHSNEISYSVTYKYKGYSKTKSYVQKVSYEPIVISGNLENIIMRNTDEAKEQTIDLSVTSPTTFKPVTLSMSDASSVGGFFKVNLNNGKKLTYSLVKEIEASNDGKKDTANFTIKASVKGKYGKEITRNFDLKTVATFERKQVDNVKLERKATDSVKVIMPKQTARIKFDVKVNNVPSLDGIGLEVVDVIKDSDVTVGFSAGNKDVLEITWSGANGTITSERSKTVKYKIRYTYDGSTRTTPEYTQVVTYEPIVLKIEPTALTFKNAERAKIVLFTLEKPLGYSYSDVNVQIDPADAAAANVTAAYNKNNGVLMLTLASDITSLNNSDKTLKYTAVVNVGVNQQDATNKEIKGTLDLKYYLEEVEKLTVVYPESGYTFILPNDGLELTYKFMDVGADVTDKVKIDNLVDMVKDQDVTVKLIKNKVSISWNKDNKEEWADRTTKTVKFKLVYTYGKDNAAKTITSKELVYTVSYEPLDVKGLFSGGKFTNSMFNTALTTTLNLENPVIPGAEVSYTLRDISSTDNVFTLSHNNGKLSLKLNDKLYTDDDGSTYNLKYTLEAALKKDGKTLGKRVFKINAPFVFEKTTGDIPEVEDLDPIDDEEGKDQSDPNVEGKGVYSVVMPGSNKAVIKYSFKDKNGEIVSVNDFQIEGTPTITVNGASESNVTFLVTANNEITVQWVGDTPSGETKVDVAYKYSFKYGKKNTKRIVNANATINFVPVLISVTPSETFVLSYDNPQYITIGMSPSGTLAISGIVSSNSNFKTALEGDKIKVWVSQRLDINFNEEVEIRYNVLATVNKYKGVAQDASLNVSKVSKIKYKYEPPFDFDIEPQDTESGKVLVADKTFFSIKAEGTAGNVTLQSVEQIAPSAEVSGDQCVGLQVSKIGDQIKVYADANSTPSKGCKLGLRVNVESAEGIAKKDFTHVYVVKPALDFNIDESSVTIMRSAVLTFTPKDIDLGIVSAEGCKALDVSTTSEYGTGGNRNALVLNVTNDRFFRSCDLKLKLKADKNMYSTSYKDFTVKVISNNLTVDWDDKIVTLPILYKEGNVIVGKLPLNNEANIDFDFSFTHTNGPNNFEVMNVQKDFVAVKYKGSMGNISSDVSHYVLKLTTKSGQKITYTYSVMLQVGLGNSVNNPVRILNTQMLIDWASNPQYWNLYYTIEWDTTYYGVGKIDLEGVDWTPIGNEATPFTGYLDGQGNTIYNLEVNGDRDNQGLFGVVRAEKKTPIKNVILADVKGRCAGDCQGSNIGGLIGYLHDTNSDSSSSFANQMIVENCLVNISPDSSIKGKNNVGGAVGKIQRARLKSVLARGNVYGYGDNIGGVVGLGQFMQTISLEESILVDTQADKITPTMKASAQYSWLKKVIKSRDVDILYKNGRVEGNNNVGGYAGRWTTNAWEERYNIPRGEGYSFKLKIFGLSSKNAVVIARGEGAGGLIGYIEGTAMLTGIYNNGYYSYISSTKQPIIMNLSWSSNSIVHAKKDYTGGLVGKYAPVFFKGGSSNKHDWANRLMNCYANNLVVAGERYTGGVIGGMPTVKNKNGDDVTADGVVTSTNTKSVIINEYEFENGEKIGAGDEADYLGFVAGMVTGIPYKVGRDYGGADVLGNLITVSNTLVAKENVGGLFPETDMSYNAAQNTFFINFTAGKQYFEEYEGKPVVLLAKKAPAGKKLALSYKYRGFTQISNTQTEQYEPYNIFYLIGSSSVSSSDYGEDYLYALCGASKEVCNYPKTNADVVGGQVPSNLLYTAYTKNNRSVLCDAYRKGAPSKLIYSGEFENIDGIGINPNYCTITNPYHDKLRIYDLPNSVQDEEPYGVKLLN